MVADDASIGREKRSRLAAPLRERDSFFEDGGRELGLEAGKKTIAWRGAREEAAMRDPADEEWSPSAPLSSPLLNWRRAVT